MKRERLFYTGLAMFAVGAVVLILSLPSPVIIKIIALVLLSIGMFGAGDAFIKQLDWSHDQSGLIVQHQTDRIESLKQIADLSLMLRLRDLKETPRVEKIAAQAHRFDNGERGKVIPLFPTK